MLCGLTLFLINGCLELIAFWQDTVWNLMAMLRFISSLLGGVLIPLAFFPARARQLVELTPFPSLFAFPIRCFMGQVTWIEWLRSALLLGIWAALSALLFSWLWRRGTRQYSGVGI